MVVKLKESNSLWTLELTVRFGTNIGKNYIRTEEKNAALINGLKMTYANVFYANLI